MNWRTLRRRSLCVKAIVKLVGAPIGQRVVNCRCLLLMLMLMLMAGRAYR